MNCASRALLVLTAVAMVGLWGCSQNKGGTGNARLRDLEARHAKLEEDYRAVVAANDNLRKKLAQADSQKTDLTRQVRELEVLVREGEKQLTARTSERDTLHAQLVQFGRDLQSLVSKIEVATAAPAAPVTPASTVSRARAQDLAR